MLADEPAAVLRSGGRVVVRASVDGFHRTRALRHARGRDALEGFSRDSCDPDALRRELRSTCTTSAGAHRRRLQR
ncbi:hypothetical protein GCM10027586_14070 [Kineococcus gypseus]|uniref:hypothetical protein n=1 Tax=Kineococcus gypseus TaxID=1637102 RepID=UPI003D7E521C